MPANVIMVDRATPMLFPPAMRDLVHFVIEAVERLPSDTFDVNERGSGSKQYPPHMILALIIYCYSNGIFSSRKIE